MNITLNLTAPQAAALAALFNKVTGTRSLEQGHWNKVTGTRSLE